MTLNGRQFRQQRLINPLSVPRRQPHQMGLMEFAQSPRTVWHASEHEDIETLRDRYSMGQHLTLRGSAEDQYEDDQGFHVGTLRAAVDRTGGRKLGGDSAYLHPGRITEVMENTRDRPIRDAGEDWTEEEHAHYYRNDYEDPGSTSAILSSPRSMHFKTHADYVEQAVRRGGIPSGAAEHDANENRSLRVHDVEVNQTDKVTAVVPASLAGQMVGLTSREIYHHSIDYKTPERKAWGTTRFHESNTVQEAMIRPGAVQPEEVRPEFIVNKRQFP